MASATAWGLASSGSISRSLLMRVPGLKHKIGPVASGSFRLASRIANTLRAGTPVRSSAELQPATVVLISVPGGQIGPLISDSFLNSVKWSRKTVLVCDSFLEPELAAAFRAQGASVGALCPLPGLTARFIVSGDRAAVKAALGLVRLLAGSAIEISQDRLILFQSALTLATSLFTPLIETALECLRQSGVAQPAAAHTADMLFQQTLRAFKHSGRKSWSGPVALADRGAVEAQYRALHSAKPLLAAYFREAANFSFELYQTFPELTRYNKERWREFQKRYPNRA